MKEGHAVSSVHKVQATMALCACITNAYMKFQLTVKIATFFHLC